jgi:transcriptional regulator with XRE-family HTH domain
MEGTTSNKGGREQLMARKERKSDPNQKFLAWIEKSKMTQNQLAAASGLSAGYIHELRKGKIVKADRKKLLALGCGLHLDLDNINELLTAFMLLGLQESDIQTFVEIATTRKLSQFDQPLYADSIYLLLLGVESLPGDLVAVVDTPSYILRSGEYVEYEKRKQGYDELHVKIMKRLHEERQNALIENMQSYRYDVYVAQKDMRRYVKRYDYFREHCNAQNQTNYILDHLLSTFQFMKQHPNHRLYLATHPHPYEFELKFDPTVNSKDAKNKLFYIAAEHVNPAWMDEEASGDNESVGAAPAYLEGYATENAAKFAQYEQEYEKFRTHLTFRSDQPDELAKLKEHIVRLFKQETQISEDPDNLRLLDALLEE